MRKILTYPNQKLFNCPWPTDRDEHVLCIIDEMIDTMYLVKGLGLAATQIGEEISVFVMDVDGDPLVAINPTVHELGETVEMEEACLSLPGISAIVPRSKYVRLIYTTLEGELRSDLFEGVQAQVVQHELDHLNGELYWNNLSPLKRSMLRKKYMKIHKIHKLDPL